MIWDSIMNFQKDLLLFPEELTALLGTMVSLPFTFQRIALIEMISVFILRQKLNSKDRGLEGSEWRHERGDQAVSGPREAKGCLFESAAQDHHHLGQGRQRLPPAFLQNPLQSGSTQPSAWVSYSSPLPFQTVLPVVSRFLSPFTESPHRPEPSSGCPGRESPRNNSSPRIGQSLGTGAYTTVSGQRCSEAKELLQLLSLHPALCERVGG